LFQAEPHPCAEGLARAKIRMNDFELVQLFCHNAEKIYLDWSILTKDDSARSSEEWLVKICMKPIDPALTASLVDDCGTLPVSAIIVSEHEEARTSAAATDFLPAAPREKRSRVPAGSGEGRKKGRREPAKGPVSYYQSLYGLTTAAGTDKKATGGTPVAKTSGGDTSIEVDLSVHQQSALGAIQADYENIAQGLPRSMKISLADFDIVDSEGALLVREVVKGLKGGEDAAAHRTRLICCLLLRQVAVGVNEYGCTFGNIIMTSNAEKLASKYPRIKQLLVKSTLALEKAVSDVQRMRCPDHPKQEKLESQVRAVMQSCGSRSKILICADAEAFFTMTAYVTRGGASCTQLSRDVGGGEVLKRSLTDSLKTHNCIFWSCEGGNAFPPSLFSSFSHVFIYSNSTAKDNAKDMGQQIKRSSGPAPQIVRFSVKRSARQEVCHQDQQGQPLSLDSPGLAPDRGSLCLNEEQRDLRQSEPLPVDVSSGNEIPSPNTDLIGGLTFDRKGKAPPSNFRNGPEASRSLLGGFGFDLKRQPRSRFKGNVSSYGYNDGHTVSHMEDYFDLDLQAFQVQGKERTKPAYEQTFVQEYSISSDEGEVDAQRSRRNVPLQQDIFARARTADPFSAEPTSLDWDTRSLLDSWNTYRNSRHYSESSQAFLGRKAKRRRTIPWGKKRF